MASCLAWLGVSSLSRSQSAVEPHPSVDFARDVRPILSQHCFKCHGPDEQTRQAGLRLDLRDAALRGGDSNKPAIVEGRTAESELIRRIMSSDPDSLMPPPSSKQQLTPTEIQTLKTWIAGGAAYANHWGFQKPQRPPLPTTRNPASTPVDTFVNAAAEQQGLALAPPADKATWLRRLSLDLIGLPPSYAEVQAYAQDHRPDARMRVIDRLLASPAFGERWARRWLDLARYADTNGYEKDRPRSVWPYRDWVIRAINDDLSLADFAIKQLAGDLLPGDTPADRIATGFHRNTMLNEEGGIDPLEYRYYAMVDRVNTTSTTWLGLTLGCAQCHNHKYDPLTQQDYYAVMALLNDTEEPEYEVFDAAIASEQRRIDSAIEQLSQSRIQSFPPAAADLQWTGDNVQTVASTGGLKWLQPRPGLWHSQGEPTDKDTTTLHIKQPSPAAETYLVAVRLKARPVDQADQANSPRRGTKKSGNQRAALGWSATSNFVITDVHLRQATHPGTPAATTASSSIALAGAQASFSQAGFPASDSVDSSPTSGWAVAGFAEADTQDVSDCEIVWYLEAPLRWNTQQSDSGLDLVLDQQHGSKHLLKGFELQLGWFTGSANQLAQARDQHLRSALSHWIIQQQSSAARWQLLQSPRTSANLSQLVRQDDGSYLAIGDITKRDEYSFEDVRLDAGTSGLMIEALTDSSLPRRGPGRTYYEGPVGDFFLSEVRVIDAAGQTLAMADAWVDYAQKGREASKAIDGDPLTGWSIDGGQGQPHRLVVKFAEPVSQNQNVSIRLLFERYHAAPMGRPRLWATSAQLTAASATSIAELQNRITQWSAQSATAPEVRDAFLAQASEINGLTARIESLRQQRPRFPTTLVMQARPAGFVRPTYRYHRGEFLNPREQVTPAVPALFAPAADSAPRDRLAFARWLVHPDHPLVPRVLANRFWSILMGRGLVTTEEDFGYQGSLPSNQALLDWLARELVADQRGNDPSDMLWSFKRWLRPILLSDTYGRDSLVAPEALAKDAGNTWLARASRRRMEAEQLRDSALAVAGLLTRQIGGPSVYPPQPASVTIEGTYGKLPWKTSEGADRYRRALYTFSKRTAPFAMSQTFDAPSGEACMARRESGDTALQALTVLNDELFIEAALELGRRTIDACPDGSPHAVIPYLFQRILVRDPSSDELKILAAYYDQQRAELAASPDSLQQLGLGNAETRKVQPAAQSTPDPLVAAATLTARILLNSDEFINRN